MSVNNFVFEAQSFIHEIVQKIRVTWLPNIYFQKANLKYDYLFEFFDSFRILLQNNGFLLQISDTFTKSYCSLILAKQCVLGFEILIARSAASTSTSESCCNGSAFSSSTAAWTTPMNPITRRWAWNNFCWETIH